MSDKEEKDNKEKEILRTCQDGGSNNPETLTEGNVLSLNSNKNTENSSTISEIMPRSAAIEGSGDNTGSNVQENSELDKIEAELTELSKELINTDAGIGSGDYSAKAKVGDIDDKIIEDINTEMNAKTCNTNVIVEKEGSNDDLLDKCDDTELKKADDFDEFEDEDMQLRWDEDDDPGNQLEGDDNANVGNKNDGTLSEDQLLEDSSDVLTEKSNLESVTLIDNSKESETNPKPEIHTDKADLASLEDELLEEPDVNTEAVKSPEMVFSAEERMDQNFLEDKLLEGSEMHSETEFIAKVKEIIDVKSMNEQIQKTKTTEKLIKEDELTHFTETLQMSSSNNDVLSKDNLLEEPDSKDESSEIISVKDPESSDNIPEKEFLMNKELDDDVLLEEKLLEEPETAEVIPESDVTMEVDDENEAELLKDDGGQNNSSTPMDVDSTDPSIEDQAKIEDTIIEQPMDDESEVGKKEIAQSNLEKVDINQTTDEIKVMNESDVHTQMTEKIIHQPVEDTTKTIEVIKDLALEEKSATVEFDKEIAIEDQAKIDKLNIDLAASEMENVNQQMNYEKKTVENSKVQLIVETNTTEESIKTPEQSDALTDSNIPNIEIEGQKKSIPDKSALEKKIVSKEEQEQPKLNKESEHADINFEKPKEIAVLDTSLDKNNVTAEVSPSSSFRDSLSPIKSFHGLNKPDVMLEIPTQELIDMDMTDLSMNLDQSDVLDSNYMEQNIKKELEDDTIDMSIAEDDTVNEKSVDNITKTVDVTTNQNAVDQDTIVTETKADKITTETDTANEKSADQQTTVTEAIVDKVPIESKIGKSGKKEETAVEATIEENMEILFADVEAEVAKEVPDCIASTSETQEQPSTSTTQMTPDTSDELPEVSDSLGLLAESTRRVMEDDEENEDDDEEDDDFDQDESSNQVSAEQSEDSNPAAIESEPVTETEDKELETPEPKESEFPFLRDSYSQDKGQKIRMEYGTMELQAETMNEMNEEATSAVAALLNADSPVIEQTKAPKETPEEMDIETVKLSDTSDNEADVEPAVDSTVGKTVAEAESSKEVIEEQKKSPSKSPLQSNVSPKQSPSKLKNLAITAQAARSVVNIVDLEESSSSDDDIQETEIQKQPSPQPETKDDKPASPDPDSTVTSVNIPTGIDIIRSVSSGGITSEITTKDGEAVISGVPKPPPHKPARLNMSEVSIKTVSSAEPMVIPETKINEQTSTQSKPKLSLEIFSLDSDEEDSAAKEKSTTPQPEMTALELEKARETSKCINYGCTSDNTVPYRVAEATEIAYYDANRKKRALVCQPCAAVVADRTKNLIQGMKDLTPLLDLDMRKSSQELVEISDSDSEDEDMNSDEPKETIGKEGAKIIEDGLTQLLNDTWKKYNMDARLKETQIMLDDEIEKLEQDSKEIDAMLNACQVATDKLRCELYATFECRLQQLPPLVIQDTPEKKFIGQEEQVISPVVGESAAIRHAKRRLSSTSNELPAKRPAIPLGYAPLDSPDAKEKAAIPAPESKLDDDKDISVVKLSAEAAPADLPPPGEISRPPLRVGMPVFAMKNAFGPFLKGKVLEIQPKNPGGGNPFSLCRVRFDHKAKSNGKVLQARSIAYSEPADVRMTIGTRLIALFKDSNKRESYYSGVVAEIPNPVNNYRYLVFFDDGYAQYVQHQYTRLVCESSSLVWEEVHPFSREFVREYLMAYPERPMVRLHTGQHLKTEWNGKWWASRVTRVDASLAQVMFVEDGRREWIYRGSTRLAPLYLELRAAERHRPRPMPRSKAQPRFNMPYVEYIRSDEQEASKPPEVQVQAQQQMQQQQLQRDEEIRRQRSVAKKSTSAPPQVYPPAHQIMPPLNTDPVTSRVVYYTPKNAVRPLKMVPHRCTPKCKRSDVLSLKELRTYNPLAKPLLSGWERQIVRFKGHKDVMYRAPCGRRIRNMRELHHYLRSIDSDLPVDLFDFHYSTHCLAEFVLNKCLVGKKDLSHGKENVPVPCVNYYDDSLPEFCSYNTERTPTAGVPLNLEPEFLCGCDCTDDCQDKSKCACWKMTLEGARTIGLVGPNVGYVYKRLPEPLPSGIYECNSRCKCKHTCLNRVAQHPLQLKLQVFKTPNRGWGIRALNDVPKGSFLCVYAGNLLTDATANLDGLNEGDEYLAELDYIEVVEQMKEGYEEDIPEADKKLDKKEAGKDGEDSDEEPSSSSEDEDTASKTDKEDDDFRPGYIGLGLGGLAFNKRLRKREKSKRSKENAATDDKDTTKDIKEPKEANAEEDCITISDDEEVREPSRFMAQTNMGANEYISKYKSVRTLFGKDEACYIMDAKVQGNIGRYLNHSCCPNVFVQNVFVDTHDPRFPWVAFFALSHIKAGTELTWNYNYDVGSVPGKVLYCYCGAVNCRGRLL